MQSKSLCVFAGAREPLEPLFVAAARELGAALATRGITLVSQTRHSRTAGACSVLSPTAWSRVNGRTAD
jgi:hypothetical protein